MTREDKVIERALKILEDRARYGDRFSVSSPQAMKDWLRLKIGLLEHEVFYVVFLNSQNQVIAFEELFRGTVNQTAVYPREVVKRALHHNAAAVMFAHNHPSAGTTEPSVADRALTDHLRHALCMVEVKVLDHFIVAGANILSFAEKGLI